MCSDNVFPFNSVETVELLVVLFNSNLGCSCPTGISLIDVPSFEHISAIRNIFNLSSNDPEANIQSRIIFYYYTPYQSHSSPNIKHSS